MNTFSMGVELMLYGLSGVFLSLFVLYGLIRLFVWLSGKKADKDDDTAV